MINSNSKFYSFFELIFVFSFFLMLALLLTSLHPYPYHLIGSIGGSAAYDGEPDYFANIISTIVNGHSMDFLHPGIPINQISALSLSFFSEPFSAEQVIIFSRATILFVNCMCIYIGSRLILKQDLISTFALLFLLLLYPAGFFLIDNLSPNSILFGLSVLIISLGSMVERRNFLYAIIFSCFLGLALAIKYIAIILILPLLVSLILGPEASNYKQTSLYKILCILISVTGISFILFAWPIAPFIPYVFTHHGFMPPDLNIFSLNASLSLLVFTIMCSISFFVIIKAYKFIVFQSISNLYLKTSAFLLTILAIISVFNMFHEHSFLSLGYSLRNYLPILGMLVLFAPQALNTIFRSHSVSVLSIILLLSFMIGLKASFNFESYREASRSEEQFSAFLQSYDEYDYLVFYPPSSFNSKDIFIAWSDYRYGDSRKVFSEEDLPFMLTPRQRKVRILNTRKFHLIAPDNKFSYQYFDYASRSKYLSVSQRSVALNQMNLLQPKNLCHELFDGFDQHQNSLLFFPSSLKSYITGNKTSSIDQAFIYVDNLKNDLLKSCKVKAKITKTTHNEQTFYLLSIPASENIL